MSGNDVFCHRYAKYYFYMKNVDQNNKRIAVNTIIIYSRMFIVSIVSLGVTRYILQKLGQSDFGLYNVVGGIVTMLNVVAVGMYTTTRRYLNVEMGKPDGNSNKIFNICLVLHIFFAILIFIVALTFGLWYINNILNVLPDKLSDAKFIYIISTTVSAVGIMNVPFVGLMAAFERFRQIAIIEIFTSLLKIPMVYALIMWTGNSLRFYSISICIISICTFIMYHGYCIRKFPEITSWRFYDDRKMYKDILIFNNYTSLGAVAYLSRTQGSSMLINCFFGTIVNGAFAVAFQIENFIVQFVNNLATASDPQITQSYAANQYNRTFALVEKISRYSVFVMLLVVVPIGIEMKYVLEVWLGTIPDGALTICIWMMFSLFIRSFNSACNSLIQASGKVKWFQIIGSFLLISGLPISAYLFFLGYPPVSIIVTFAISDFFKQIANIILLRKEINFDIYSYIKAAFYPVLKVLMAIVLYIVLYKSIDMGEMLNNIGGIIITFMYIFFVCFYLGVNHSERNYIVTKIQIIGNKVLKNFT